MEQGGKCSSIASSIRAAARCTEQTDSKMRDDWKFFFFKRCLYKVETKNVETKLNVRLERRMEKGKTEGRLEKCK